MIDFKLEGKKQPLKDTKNWNFQTLKDKTSTPTILPYKPPLPPGFSYLVPNGSLVKVIQFGTVR